MHRHHLVNLVVAFGLAACSGSQAASSEGPATDATAVATSEATADATANATAAGDAATASATSTVTAVAHAPGGARCNDLAKACHDVGHGADDAGKCHQIGHAGDAAACDKEYARCVAVCKKAADKGGHGHSKGHHAP